MKGKNIRSPLFTILLAFLCCFFPATVALAATFTVNTTTDSVDANPGDGLCADASGLCSLRAAVMEANALSGADNIVVPAGVYRLTLSGVASEATGDLNLTSSITISGASAATTIIDGDNTFRVLDISGSASVVLRDLTIANGYVLDEAGAGIRITNATLSTQRVIVSGCTASTTSGSYAAVGGGGIANRGGTVSVVDSRITGNQADGNGGGVYNGQGTGWGTMTVQRSTVDNNTSLYSYGGGFHNEGSGGYSVGARLELYNVTISGNRTLTNGGGGYSATQGSINYLSGCTVAFNTDPSGNGGSGFMGNGAASYSVHNTIVSNNSGGSQCYQFGSTSAGLSFLDPQFDLGLPYGFNLTDGDCYTNGVDNNIVGTPNLGALAQNGGFAPTHLPGTGSAAIDLGDPVNYENVDQIGATRPQDGNGDGVARADVGAVEIVPTVAPGSLDTGLLGNGCSMSAGGESGAASAACIAVSLALLYVRRRRRRSGS